MFSISETEGILSIFSLILMIYLHFKKKKYILLYLLVSFLEYLEPLFDVLASNEVIDFVFVTSFANVSLCQAGIAGLSSLA